MSTHEHVLLTIMQVVYIILVSSPQSRVTHVRSTPTGSQEDARTSASSVGATNPEAAAVKPDSSWEATASPARVSKTFYQPLFPVRVMDVTPSNVLF